jgi:hypothetical protein
MDTSDDTDSLFLSDSDDDNTEKMNTSSKTIYDIDISTVNPEFMRIFNLTPPLENTSSLLPDTIIPYYVIIVSPIPKPYETTSYKHGQAMYSKFVQTIESEILDILIWWVNQIDLDMFVVSPPYCFDDLYKSYYMKNYTRAHPFTFYYFVNGKWDIYKLTSISKDRIFNMFYNNFHKYVVL